MKLCCTGLARCFASARMIRTSLFTSIMQTMGGGICGHCAFDCVLCSGQVLWRPLTPRRAPAESHVVVQVFKIVMTDLGQLQQVKLALDEDSKSEGW